MLPKIWSAVTASTLLLLLAANISFAQDAEPYCAQLEAADCVLLSASAEAMQDIQSMRTDSNMSFNLTDIPDMPVDELSLNYSQSTVYSIDPEAMAFIKELQEMTPLEMEAMFNNPVAAVDFLETIISSMNMSVSIDLDLSDELLAMANEEFRAEAGMDLPADLGLQLRFIDGIIYADLSTIATMVPEIGMFVQGWVGVDSAPLLQLAKSEMANAGIDESFDLGSGSELEDNPFAAMSMNQAGPLITQVGDLDPSGDVYTYLNVERLAEGTDVVSFVTTMDYDAFMKTNSFRDLVYTLMTQDGATVTAQELDETVSLAQIMAPAFLKDFFLEVTEMIAPSSGYMMGGTMTLDWDLKSILTLAAQNDPSLTLDPEAEPNVSVSSLATNTSINEEISIEAPEGAFVVPMEMLMMLMNS